MVAHSTILRIAKCQIPVYYPAPANRFTMVQGICFGALSTRPVLHVVTVVSLFPPTRPFSPPPIRLRFGKLSDFSSRCRFNVTPDAFAPPPDPIKRLYQLQYGSLRAMCRGVRSLVCRCIKHVPILSGALMMLICCFFRAKASSYSFRDIQKGSLLEMAHANDRRNDRRTDRPGGPAITVTKTQFPALR